MILIVLDLDTIYSKMHQVKNDSMNFSLPVRIELLLINIHYPHIQDNQNISPFCTFFSGSRLHEQGQEPSRFLT